MTVAKTTSALTARAFLSYGKLALKRNKTGELCHYWLESGHFRPVSRQSGTDGRRSPPPGKVNWYTGAAYAGLQLVKTPTLSFERLGALTRPRRSMLHFIFVYTVTLKPRLKIDLPNNLTSLTPLCVPARYVTRLTAFVDVVRVLDQERKNQRTRVY